MRSSVRSRLAPPISITYKAILLGLSHCCPNSVFSFQNSGLDRESCLTIVPARKPRCGVKHHTTSASWTCITSPKSSSPLQSLRKRAIAESAREKSKPEQSRGECLLTIDLGFDESGSSDTLLVSVQLTVVHQNRKLRRQWKNRLLEDGVEYFHSCEFDNMSSGVFADLSRPKRLSLLNDLSKLAHRHLLVGITGKLSKSFYKEKTDQKFRSRWGSEYTFAIQKLVVCAYIYANRFGLKPEFNIFIEDGHAHGDAAIKSLHETKKAGLARAVPSKLLNIGLGSKADCPILQAADMLAYSDWQYMNSTEAEIFEAIHPENTCYTTAYVDFDKELVEIIKDSADKWLVARKEFGRLRHEQRISKLRPNDETVDKGSTSGDHAQTGGGDIGEDAEKAAV